MKYLKHTALLFFSILLVSSCLQSPYYQKEYALKGNAWDYDNELTFKFNISDTNALYNLHFLIRHTDAYPYSNIWLVVHTKRPGDTVFERTRLEVPLAEPNGKWLGRGMGEIWEQRMPISRDGDTKMLREEGIWEIKLTQNMRINPLPEILQAGIRIEKKAKP